MKSGNEFGLWFIFKNICYYGSIEMIIIRLPKKAAEEEISFLKVNSTISRRKCNHNISTLELLDHRTMATAS